MGPCDRTEPSISDYYADLGLTQQASFRDVKLTYFKLAREHHPDKKAPGMCTDAHDFRKIHKAYDCLFDKSKRAEYDAHYFDLQGQWITYRKHQEAEHRNEEQKRVDEERKRADEEQRDARRRAKRERLRRKREMEAEKKLEAAATKIRIEQERAAQERLNFILIEEQQGAIRRNWTKMREAAEHRKREPAPFIPSACAHPPFGWPKKKCSASCVFCGVSCSKWVFQCPDCKASACQGCKSKYGLH